MSKKDAIQLSADDRKVLKQFLSSGKAKPRCIKRGLALDGLSRGMTIKAVMASVGISQASVYNVVERFNSGGLERVITDTPAPGQPPKLTGTVSAILIALACSKAPEGHTCWTMQLLADKLIELKVVESITAEGVRVHLKKVKSSPGLKLSGALLR